MDNRDEFKGATVFCGSPIANVLYEIFFAIPLLFVPYILLTSTSAFRQFAGVVSIPVVLWLFARITCNLYRGRRAMIAIGERGFFDWRISNAWIPWSAIREIDEAPPISYWGWRRYGLSFKIDPEFLPKFPEKILARVLRILNQWCGLPGFAITLMGVDANFDQVKAALERYCPLWRQVLTDEVRK